MSPVPFLLMCSTLLLVCSAAEDKKNFYQLESAEIYFNQFMDQYNKVYESETEKNKRYQIFKDNLVIINKKNLNGNQHAEFGITKFSDLTHEEFKGTYGCLDLASAEACQLQATLRNESVPEEFDWRKNNKVTKVKDQQSCGSCWSFSTTGSLEGQYAIKHNVLKEFSEQQLVDCVKTNKGCGGGLMSNAFLYYKSNGPILEADYPYTGHDGQCRYEGNKVAAKVLDCYQHSHQKEDDLKGALVQYGPLAIAIDATDLSGYQKGILEACAGNKINHAVLVVGYGTENNIPYWIIKNSWGSNWGENGYFRIKRNINACKIMNPLTVSAKIE